MPAYTCETARMNDTLVNLCKSCNTSNCDNNIIKLGVGFRGGIERFSVTPPKETDWGGIERRSSDNYLKELSRFSYNRWNDVIELKKAVSRYCFRVISCKGHSRKVNSFHQKARTIIKDAVRSIPNPPKKIGTIYSHKKPSYTSGIPDKDRFKK